MKKYLNQLDKAFENRIRLGIMSILSVNDWTDFSTLKELLEVTDGNLASHMAKLEKEDYVTVQKGFVGRKPNTTFSVTEKGRKAFQNHLNALENILKSKH